jgi:NAD(P)-dependent dehydrogenase (short-subunit alcohol dehydrogenase family)
MLLAPFTSEQGQMVEVDLLGAMSATEVFLGQLREGGGDLVSISSVAGRTARAGNAAYAARRSAGRLHSRAPNGRSRWRPRSAAIGSCEAATATPWTGSTGR